MKSQKGITLTSLVVYITVVLIVVGILAVITANMQGNIKEIYAEGTNNAEIDKFNVYFLKEVKKQGNAIDEDEFSSNEVLFITGNKYTFNNSDKCIYLNDNIKIAENIEKCVFNSSIVNEKTVVIVTIKAINAEEKTIEYVLNYEKLGNNYEDENNYINNILAKEYQQLEYIENNGTQFIDTGFIPNVNTNVDIVYKSLRYSTSQYILGARDGTTGTIQYSLNGSSSRTDWDVRFNGVATYMNSELLRNDHKYQSTILMQNGAATWTLTDLDESITKMIEISSVTVNATTNLFLFAYNNSNIHANLRIYSCKIYDGENLIRDFIPCYRISDNVAGLYDLVNNKFYINAGTGEFVLGPEVL